MKHNKNLDHTLTTPDGHCAACQFLRTAIEMMAEEYKPEYQRMLDQAQEEHTRQPELFEVKG